ncbi:MAG: hypothetical protein A4S09_17490 [Proteobacteria bacterium SG_bin7]|nr:MAG: hypothetical protein A4S09_17490 [Proteobacteria bacterium SG_bin7]
MNRRSAKKRSPRKWIPKEITLQPVPKKEQEYKKIIEELAEIVYSTFKPVRKSPNSTATGSIKKLNTSEGTKFA